VADADKVDLTNLQRQILYRAEAVGTPKVQAARSALHGLNPEIEIVAVERRLAAADAEKLVAESDLVLDCTDNFATRHLLNRACVAQRKPLVSGAAIRFDGQVMVFDLRDPGAPCYACLFPEEGEVEEVQCSVMGVFAPLTGWSAPPRQWKRSSSSPASANRFPGGCCCSTRRTPSGAPCAWPATRPARYIAR
jgi:molybdopterin/thiamine biosynthesis adenylyltransferase